jgi:hypothetical protein
MSTYVAVLGVCYEATSISKDSQFQWHFPTRGEGSSGMDGWEGISRTGTSYQSVKDNRGPSCRG